MQDQFIEGIHNYCDRWCERCPFTAQCEVYAAEQGLTEDEKDPTKPAFWLNLKKNFEEILESLNEKMAELGIEMDDDDQTPEPEPDPAVVAREEQMREAALHYGRSVEAFFKDNTTFFEQKNEELAEQIEDSRPVDLESLQFFQDAVEVIRWYQYFIAAKIDRSVGGLGKADKDDDFAQSDANGSAKIAMIALERSLGAWEVVVRRLPEKQEEIRELQHQLQHLRAKMLELFPNWRVFHRPGFDDHPQNTLRLDFNPN
ncbi:MAG: hypothetical protein JNJ90_01000 [Saprospiraceae bacterium]|jgi:hypothetical protein|nr:hypothetical protein [Saprospiraceae bacterium]